MPNDLMTSKQVERMLQVSGVTLWRWRKSGLITPVKIGNVIRYRREDIARIINRELPANE